MITIEDIRVKCTPEQMAARNDIEIAAMLSVGRVRVASVSRQQFAAWAASTGMRSAIETHANDATSPLYSQALSYRDFIQGAADSLDLSQPTNRDILAMWVTHGAITQATADALLTLASVDDPVGFIEISDVLNAAGIGPV